MLGALTASVTRYLQQAGRSMRPAPDKTALVMDLAGISHELGLPDEVREWSLDDGEVTEPTEKAHKIPRCCKSCATLYYGGRCPTCSEPYPLAEVEMVETELEIATPSPRPKRPAGGRRAELNRELAVARQSPDPYKALVAIGERRGYKPSWANVIWGLWTKERMRSTFV